MTVAQEAVVGASAVAWGNNTRGDVPGVDGTVGFWGGFAEQLSTVLRSVEFPRDDGGMGAIRLLAGSASDVDVAASGRDMSCPVASTHVRPKACIY